LFSNICLKIWSSHLPSDYSTKGILYDFSFSIRGTCPANLTFLHLTIV
jgi:hypothetical protein